MYEISSVFGFALIALSLGGLLGFVLKWMIVPKGAATSPGDLGRKWMGWAVLIACLALFTQFVIKPSPETFIAWAASTIVWGLIAYCLGWVYGRFVLKAAPPISSVLNPQENPEPLGKL
jgi:hypothetical protein